MTKRTYQPKTRKRARRHGFFARIKNGLGSLRILKRRRNKQRKQLTKTVNSRYK